MSERARQFIPFAALRGYYDLIRERERVTEPKRELTEEHAQMLSRKMSQVRKGMMLSVVYYHTDAYETMEGLVTAFDPMYRSITIVKTKIPLDDVWDIAGDGIVEDEAF